MEERLDLNPILSAAEAEVSAGDSLLLPGQAKRSCKTYLEDEVTRLFDQLRSPLLRYLMSFGLAPHDGEEVIQEVFLSLFQHLHCGKSRRNLRGWVFRVAHNLGLKRCYANRRSVSLMIGSGYEKAGDCLDQNPDPEEQLAGRQRQKWLMTAFLALPPQDQRCLHLRAEGLRYREIAGVLGISLGGVALSLERSLKRLADADGR
jgi:RNA polymerase sigma-70 factor (ECF subfamily)